jgi:hypothetical protein
MDKSYLKQIFNYIFKVYHIEEKINTLEARVSSKFKHQIAVD